MNIANIANFANIVNIANNLSEWRAMVLCCLYICLCRLLCTLGEYIGGLEEARLNYIE